MDLGGFHLNGLKYKEWKVDGWTDRWMGDDTAHAALELGCHSRQVGRMKTPPTIFAEASQKVTVTDAKERSRVFSEESLSVKFTVSVVWLSKTSSATQTRDELRFEGVLSV